MTPGCIRVILVSSKWLMYLHLTLLSKRIDVDTWSARHSFRVAEDTCRTEMWDVLRLIRRRSCHGDSNCGWGQHRHGTPGQCAAKPNATEDVSGLPIPRDHLFVCQRLVSGSQVCDGGEDDHRIPHDLNQLLRQWVCSVRWGKVQYRYLRHWMWLERRKRQKMVFE